MFTIGKMVTVTSWDHKSKMRILEQGNTWEVITSEREGSILLKSPKGWYKWWKTSCITSN